MLWPLQGLPAFVTGSNVVSSIVGWKSRQSTKGAESPAGVVPRFLVLAAEKDVLCTPSLLFDAAKRYRAAFHHCIRVGMLDGVSEYDSRVEDEESEDWDGVTFKVVRGLAHHMQNHVEWERGAKELLDWVEKL